jgi:hypothetical protein
MSDKDSYSTPSLLSVSNTVNALRKHAIKRRSTEAQRIARMKIRFAAVLRPGPSHLLGSALLPLDLAFHRHRFCRPSSVLRSHEKTWEREREHGTLVRITATSLGTRSHRPRRPRRRPPPEESDVCVLVSCLLAFSIAGLLLPTVLCVLWRLAILTPLLTFESSGNGLQHARPCLMARENRHTPIIKRPTLSLLARC